MYLFVGSWPASNNKLTSLAFASTRLVARVVVIVEMAQTASLQILQFNIYAILSVYYHIELSPYPFTQTKVLMPHCNATSQLALADVKLRPGAILEVGANVNVVTNNENVNRCQRIQVYIGHLGCKQYVISTVLKLVVYNRPVNLSTL